MKAKKLLKLFKSRTKCFNININTISKENLHHEKESEEPWFKCRYVVTLIWFLLMTFMSGSRMNMSVTIVAMVNNSALTKQTGNTSYSCPDPLVNLVNQTLISEDVYMKTEEFDWSPEIQGYIHSSYYLAYLLVQVPVGRLIERYGCKWITFGGASVAAVATILLPVTARLHYYIFMAMQMLRGGGVGIFPTSASLISANWFPNTERGLLYGIILSGIPMGAFVSSIISGLLCKSSLLGGWPSSFYVAGLMGLVSSFIVACFLHESPNVHPRITDAELKYILNNQENALSRRRPDPPCRKIFSSVPVYAVAIGCFGHTWAVSQFMVVNSTYLGTILHYPIDKNGYLSAVPFLLMFLCSLTSGWLSTFLTIRKYCSVDHVRKLCNSIGSLGVSLCLLGMYFSGCDLGWSSTFTILSVGFTGFGLNGVWITPTDMSPTFAACVNSFCSMIGFLPFITLPLVVGYLTNESQTLDQWNKIFLMNTGIVMTCGLIFSCFGSAKLQPWNFVNEDKKKGEDENTRI